MTNSAHTLDSSPIPAAAGIGLRLQHLADVTQSALDRAPVSPWLEIHSETFLNPGGPRLAMLMDIRECYPISCHGVGLSLGSAQGLSADHLRRLRTLFDRVKPSLVSEHLAWSVVDGAYLNDLLPLPTTAATLAIVSDNIARAQEFFGRQILVENPSTYLTFNDSTIPEHEFLAALVQRTGCGLLLDINNIYVSAINNGLDPLAYVNAIPPDAVGEIHLAGHMVDGEGEDRVLIDTHSDHVCDAVWELYARVIADIGSRPTLIEWDMNIPALPLLCAEAARAQSVLTSSQGVPDARVA